VTPEDGIALTSIPGSLTPACIGFTLAKYASLERDVAFLADGVVLNVDMQQEAVVDLYRQIQDLARTKGWELPRDEPRTR